MKEKIYATYNNIGERVGTPLGEGILDAVDAGGAYWVYFEEQDEIEQFDYGDVWLLETKAT